MRNKQGTVYPFTICLHKIEGKEWLLIKQTDSLCMQISLPQGEHRKKERNNIIERAKWIVDVLNKKLEGESKGESKGKSDESRSYHRNT